MFVLERIIVILAAESHLGKKQSQPNHSSNDYCFSFKRLLESLYEFNNLDVAVDILPDHGGKD